MLKRGKIIPIIVIGCLGFSLLFLCSIEAIAQTLKRDVIKIGVAAALKRPFGVGSLRGAEMAAKEINDAGGILGAKIQLVSGDTEATAPKATEVIEKLYYTDKVDAIVGAWSSEEATAFQEEAAKLKINILFQGTTSILDDKYKANPEKYKYGWNYVTRDTHYVDHVKNQQLNLFVSAVKKQLALDKANIAVITDQSLATEKLHVEWEEAVKSRPDCKLVYSGKIARDAVDFTGEISEMRAKNTQLILLYSGYSAGYPFIKQIYDIKLPAVTFGMNVLAWSVPDFLKAVGVDAAAYNSTLALNTLPTTPNTAKLLKTYERVYGGAAHPAVGLAYNGVKAYTKAVQIARSLDHDKVQQAIEKLRLPENEAWNCKEFRFDDSHRVYVSPKDGFIICTFQIIEGGAVNLLEPAEYKTGEPLLPPWMVKHWKKK